MRHSQAGITLLEVLISLALMSFIAIGLSSIGKTGSQAWARLETGSNTDNYALTRYQLRQDLEALPLVRSGLLIDEVFQVQQSGTSILIFSQPEEGWTIDWSDGVLTYGNTAVTQENLYPNVQDISVTYYGLKSPRTTAGWFEDWQNATLVPQLIKFEVTNSDGRAYPPLTVQPAKLERQSEISASSLFPPA